MHKVLQQWLAAVAVFSGATMGTIDTFVLYVATPHLRGIFSATTAEISWVSTSYAVTALVCMPLSGWLCNRFGKKRVYLYALTGFVIASALCGAASSLSFLVATRFLQGAFAGILLPVEVIILRGLFPPAKHGQVLGIYSASIMLGPALGPLIGGYIVDNHHWSNIFFVNIPIGILGILMTKWFVSEDPTETKEQAYAFDWLGLVLLSAGIFCLIWLLERGDRLRWFEDTENCFLIGISISTLALFVAHELEIENPIVNFRILSYRVFAATLTMNFLLYYIVTASLFVLPIYMQDLLQFSPTKAGETLAPRAFAMMVTFPVVGILFNRVHPKALICSGLVLGTYSSMLMIRFTHETGIEDMYVPLILQGVAVVMVLMPLTTLGLMHVRSDQIPAAAGLEATFRQFGASLGVATFAALITQFELSAWGEFRHSVSLHFPVFFKRFDGVIEYFNLMGFTGAHAREKATRLLNERVTEQVLAVTYRNIFQIVVGVFVTLLVLAAVLRLDKPKESAQTR